MNLKTRIVIAGVLSILLAAQYIYETHDRNANFALVDARVAQVEKVCVYHPSRNSKMSKDYIRQPCAEAERFAAQDRSLNGWMDEQYAAMVDYVSPVDQRSYSQRMYFHASKIPGELKVGDVVSILASKTDRYQIIEK